MRHTLKEFEENCAIVCKAKDETNESIKKLNALLDTAPKDAHDEDVPDADVMKICSQIMNTWVEMNANFDSAKAFLNDIGKTFRYIASEKTETFDPLETLQDLETAMQKTTAEIATLTPVIAEIIDAYEPLLCTNRDEKVEDVIYREAEYFSRRDVQDLSITWETHEIDATIAETMKSSTGLDDEDSTGDLVPGILLHGPASTGKASIAEAYTHTLAKQDPRLVMYSISHEFFVNMIENGILTAIDVVNALFHVMKESKCDLVVLFLRNLDTLIQKHQRSVITHLFHCIDVFKEDEDAPVLGLVASCESKKVIPKSLRSAFYHKVHVPLPTETQRKHFFERQCAKQFTSHELGVCETLAKHTEGYNFSSLIALLRKVSEHEFSEHKIRHSRIRIYAVPRSVFDTRDYGRMEECKVLYTEADVPRDTSNQIYMYEFCHTSENAFKIDTENKDMSRILVPVRWLMSMPSFDQMRPFIE